MALFDWTKKNDPQGRGNFNNQQEELKGQDHIIIRYFDAEVDPMTIDDFMVVAIDKGMLVKEISTYAVQAQGTATLAIGDSAGTGTFAATQALTANTLVVIDDKAKFYATAEDGIRIRPSAALTTAKFYLIIKVLRLVQ